ncbi:MAG: hypothetical protein HC897_13840, partial [Thermoanaerobaculia bacterium]|nr:hypothetical protein [Thermoanaerobaculia bacterium]
MSHVPIPYRDGCRVVLVGAEASKLWFQIGFHRLRDAEGVVSFTGREDLSALAALLELRGQDPGRSRARSAARRGVSWLRASSSAS